MEHPAAQETEICHNCKKEVPQQNYLMHVAHCARNVCICPICNEAVAKSRLQEHKDKRHKIIQCPACKEKIEASAMKVHKADKCVKRMISCQHCELELPQADLDDHVYHCGARTDRCEECGELVMLKYQKLHKESNHGFIKLDDEPGPNPSWVTHSAKNNNTNSSSNRIKQNGSSTNARVGSLHDLRALHSALSPPVNVSEEKTNCAKEMEREERRQNEDVPPRDLPRTFVPVYDASEDLRAKVKLARHDLNNIKHSVLAGKERAKQLTRQARAPLGPDLQATGRRPPPTFRTNLIPYEKNKSYAVNALPLGSQPAQGPQSGCFTYLGAPAAPLPQQNGLVSIASTPSAHPNRGAVPRTHKKNKAPAPPPPVPASLRDDLPCEFCGQLVAAHQLVLHETACRPDLAQIKVSETSPADTASPSSEVELPCEFCCSLIPASRLLSHQALCDV